MQCAVFITEPPVVWSTMLLCCGEDTRSFPPHTLVFVIPLKRKKKIFPQKNWLLRFCVRMGGGESNSGQKRRALFSQLTLKFFSPPTSLKSLLIDACWEKLKI